MSYELTTLGEYISVQGGYAFKSKDFCNEGSPVLKIKNVRFGNIDFADCAFVADSVVIGLDRFKTSAGDILISMTGSGPNAPQSLVGRVAKLYEDDQAAYINQRVGRIQIKEDIKLDPDFVFYLLQQKSSIDYLVANSTGSANQANINSATICSVPCPKVTFEESAAIANVLRNIDLGIRNNTQTNDTLEKIAQRIFKSWFVDFDPVKANAEDVPFDGLSSEIQTLFPNEFEDSDLGIIPKGWSISSVSHICDKIVNGSTPRRSTEEFWENGDVSWFKTGELKDSFLLSSGEKITNNAVENTSVKVLPKNSVLMAIYASPTVGRLGILTEDSAFNQAATGMVPNKEIGHTFLYYILKFGRLWFNNCSSGAAQQNISKLIVENYEFMMPTKQLINQFNNISTPIFEKIKNNQRQIEVLTSIRDKLLPRLISGKITIQKAEELLEAAS